MQLSYFRAHSQRLIMTPERFGELLRRPALLSSQNATALEELIARFPWCGPLRALRYKKAVLDGSTEDQRAWRSRAEPFLDHAARASADEALRGQQPAKATAHFDFVAPQDAQPEVLAEDAPLFGQAPDLAELVAGVMTATDTSEWYLLRHGLIMDDRTPRPTPREKFDSYRAWKARRAETAWSDLLQLADKQPLKRKHRKPKTKAATTQPVVASETLAGLLADQGHVDKAIHMYELLALRYPTKSDTFAARIAELKQQLA